jgi:hypothetical protein
MKITKNRLKSIGVSGLATIGLLIGSLAQPLLAHAQGQTYPLPTAGPTITAAYNNSTQLIDLSWTPAATTTGSPTYSLQVRSSGSGPLGWTNVAGTSNLVTYASGNTATSFSAGGTSTTGNYVAFVSGTSYDFEVSESTAAAVYQSQVANVVFGTANGGTIVEASAPTNLTVAPDSAGTGFNVSWTAPTTVGSNPITGYQLNIYDTYGDGTSYQPASTSTTTSYDVPAAYSPYSSNGFFVAGGSYAFSVTALTSTGDSSNVSPYVDGTLQAASAGGTGATVTPKAPDTAVQSLILANPLTVLALGIIAAATVILTGRRLTKTTK